MNKSRVGRVAAHTGLWLACLALAACGGGSGGSSPTSTASSTGSSADAAADTGTPATTDTAATLSLVTERISRTLGTSPGAGYFVDAGTGSDTNPGSFTQPWKSLAKLSSVTLRSGEGIYLRCGSVWREPLVLTRTQLVDGSKLAPYGADCTAANKPRISAADNVSGSWTKSGNIWSRQVGTSMPKISKVLVNGVRLRTAQWPNYSAGSTEWALTAAGAANSNTAIALSAADQATLAGKDIAGATVQIRSEPWFIEARSAVAIQAGALKLASGSEHPMNAGDGFVLQDKAWMLDAPGEFFHDAAAGMLYVYAPDAATQANLNAAVVEVMARDVALGLSGRSNLVVSNLSVDMARTDGVNVNDAPGSVLDGVDSSNNLGAGVRINNATLAVATSRSVTVRNGRYVNNSNSGIDTDNALNADVVSNIITGTGMGQAEWSNAAIIAGDGGLIDRNVIDQSSFRGILFSGFAGTTVSNNTLTNYCMRLSDCAAIYTVNSMNRQAANQVSTVDSNRVMEAKLNVDGTVGGHILAAIYLDDLTRGVNVRQNVIVGTPIGIYVHNSSNNLVDANRVWLTTNVGLMANMDRTNGDVMTGNTFRGNQFAPTSSVAGVYPALPQFTSSQAIRFLHALRGGASLTSGSNVFAGNRVVAFNGDTETMADVGFTTSTGWLNANAWLALNPADLQPASAAVYLTSRPTLGAELLTGGSFDAGIGSWTSFFNIPGLNNSSAVAVSGLNGCEQQCAKLTVGQLGDRLSSPLFRMAAGAQYRITFKAIFGGTADITHPNIARPDTPYESYIAAPGLKSSNSTLSGNAGDVINYEAFFTSSSSDEARINLRVWTVGVPVAFDSVSLRPVTGYTVSNFKDWGAIVSAPNDAAKTVDCASLGWSAGCSVIDIDGNAVPMPATLPAGTTKLLLWANSAWKI